MNDVTPYSNHLGCFKPLKAITRPPAEKRGNLIFSIRPHCYQEMQQAQVVWQELHSDGVPLFGRGRTPNHRYQIWIAALNTRLLKECNAVSLRNANSKPPKEFIQELALGSSLTGPAGDSQSLWIAFTVD